MRGSHYSRKTLLNIIDFPSLSHPRSEFLFYSYIVAISKSLLCGFLTYVTTKDLSVPIGDQKMIITLLYGKNTSLRYRNIALRVEKYSAVGV